MSKLINVVVDDQGIIDLTKKLEPLDATETLLELTLLVNRFNEEAAALLRKLEDQARGSNVVPFRRRHG